MPMPEKSPGWGYKFVRFKEEKNKITGEKQINIQLGKEKGKGLLQGIIDSIYQSAFGEEAYPSIEEKAANLLYFIIKDHPFVDGCKRIAATTFLYFLDMNRILYKNNKKILSDSTLVALTLLIAESKPQEKEIMINIVMNFLTW